MRHPIHWCAIAVLLSQCSFFAATASTENRAEPFPSWSLPGLQQLPCRPESLLTRFRNGLIRSIWSIPSHNPGQGVETRPTFSRPSTPPSTLLARYGGDVVLRFSVKTPEEVVALTDAVNVLFLDVWESNADWVDIRLSKDVVRSLKRGTLSQFN